LIKLTGGALFLILVALLIFVPAQAIVMVERDGAWQLGNVMDPIGTQVTAVFPPVSTTTMIGTVACVATERVRHLDLPVSDAVMRVQKLGMGSADAFKEIDLAEATRRT
jgi:uncharacterized membrane protein